MSARGGRGGGGGGGGDDRRVGERVEVVLEGRKMRESGGVPPTRFQLLRPAFMVRGQFTVRRLSECPAAATAAVVVVGLSAAKPRQATLLTL